MTTGLPVDGLHRRYIDPTTHDFVIEAGVSKQDPTLGTTVAMLLSLERGSCVWAPELGSRLHTLQHATTRAGVLAKAYAAEALVPLRKQGRLPGLSIIAGVSGNQLRIEVSWKAADGRRVDPLVYSRRIGV